MLQGIDALTDELKEYIKPQKEIAKLKRKIRGDRKWVERCKEDYYLRRRLTAILLTYKKS